MHNFSKVSLNKRLMTIATEIRIVELKNQNMHKDYEEMKLKLETSEKTYEENLKNMTLEFNNKKRNYEAMIENLQMELEFLKKELEILRVKIFILFKKINKKHQIQKENNETLANLETKRRSYNIKKHIETEEKEENDQEQQQIPQGIQFNSQEDFDQNDGKVRVFASYFQKEVEEHDVIKSFTEDALFNDEEDLAKLKWRNKGLEEEAQLYRSQIEDLTKENEELSKKNAELKLFEENNKELEKIKEDYEQEIEIYKREKEKSNKEMHLLRAQIFENKQYMTEINELKEKIAIIEKEKAFMIENTIYFKEEMAQNYNFYNEELEKTKKQFIQLKLDSSHVLMEKGYLELKCKEYENLLKIQK